VFERRWWRSSGRKHANTAAVLSSADKAVDVVLFRPSPKEAVMRTLMVALGLAVVVPAITALPAAADDKPGEKVDVVVEQRLQDLNLTDDQEAKIAAIRKEFHPKVEEDAKKVLALIKEEVEKARAVLTPEQKEKLEAAKEERKEQRAERLASRLAHLKELELTPGEITKIGDIRKEFRPKIVKAMEGLQGMLNDEQRKIRTEGLTSGKKRKEILEALNLSDDQRKKVETVGKELSTLVRDELEQMRDVLTETQKEKLQDIKDERKEHVRDRMAHRIAHLKDLNLSEEQRTKIAEIRKDYRGRIHEAGNQLRATVREEVEQVVAVLKK
jgi:Spy/CpxP family protein refolding chaperone